MSWYGIYRKSGRKVSKSPLAVVRSQNMKSAANLFARKYRGHLPGTIRVYRVKLRKKR